MVVLGLAAGFVVAAWWVGDPQMPSPESADVLTTELRLDALEESLAAEVRRRLEIETELAALNERLASGVAVDELAGAESFDSPEDRLEPADATRSTAAPAGPTMGRRRPPLDEDELIQRFVAAGLSPERAQWIVARTEELRMLALQERYDAAREGRPIDPSLAGRAGSLREELGDADYERYLQALDRPTSAQVREVLATSPGARAGLKPGDQIVAFDGERVFDLDDINRLVLEGEPGQVVAIDVIRDGQVLQLYVPRGPIGITGDGRPFPPFR